MTHPVQGAETPADQVARTLLKLADRCEKATGPDLILDQDVARAIGWKFVREGHPIGCVWYDVAGRARALPAYTASLDAAITLIPHDANSAGEIWRAEGYSDPGVLAQHVRASGWVAGAARVYAATPALALTAAALRARASQELRI